MDLARNVIKIEERDGKVVIYNKAQGGLKPLVERKSDRGLGNASKDLGALWYYNLLSLSKHIYRMCMPLAYIYMNYLHM